MRRIVLVSLFALAVAGASAQVRGGGARGVARGGITFRPALLAAAVIAKSPVRAVTVIFPMGTGISAVAMAIPAMIPRTMRAAPTHAPQPVFMMQPPITPPVVEPPRPAHPVLTNYTWPAASAPTAAVAPEAETPTFGIVLKDGSTLAATTVVASDGVLHIVDPDERHLRVSMGAVDRAATVRLNRERKLDLYLPASPQ